MGNYASRMLSASNSAVNTVYRGRKRKCIEENDLESESKFIDKTMQTPKRYVYVPIQTRKSAYSVHDGFFDASKNTTPRLHSRRVLVRNIYLPMCFPSLCSLNRSFSFSRFRYGFFFIVSRFTDVMMQFEEQG